MLYLRSMLFFFICIISLHLLQISITLYYKHININDKSIFCNFVEKHISFYFLCRSRNVNFKIFFYVSVLLCLWRYFWFLIEKIFILEIFNNSCRWHENQKVLLLSDFYKKIPSNSICNEFFVIFSTLKFILRNFWRWIRDGVKNSTKGRVDLFFFGLIRSFIGILYRKKCIGWNCFKNFFYQVVSNYPRCFVERGSHNLI